MIECKAVIKGDWKLLFLAPPYGNNEWSLFNLRQDPRELSNVAADCPDKLAEMLAEWMAYAKAVGYIEATGDKILAHMSAEEFFSRYGFQYPQSVERQAGADDEWLATPRMV